MDLPRRRVRRPLRRKQRRGKPSKIVRDREGSEPVTEDRNQDVARRVCLIDPLEAGDRTPQGREQTQLVGAPKAVRRQALELADNSLSGRLANARRGYARELLRRLVKPKTQLVLETNRTEEAQRIVVEHRPADRPEPPSREVGLPVERIDENPAVQGAGERVDREVSRGEVLLDAGSVQRSEVDGLSVAGRDAPGAVPFGEREHGAARET